MKGFWVIYKKELKEYFSTPMAYLMLSFFLLVAGYFFYINVSSGYAEMSMLFTSPLFITMLLIAPILTMRLLAEEKKLLTFELLLTSPISTFALIFAKFLAAMTVISIGILITVLYPILVSPYTTVYAGKLVAYYLGFFLLTGAFISIGIFASSLTDDQFIAGIIAFAINLFLVLLDAAADKVNVETLKIILRELTFSEHYLNFLDGIIYLKDLAFFVLWIFLMLVISQKVVESKTWR